MEDTMNSAVKKTSSFTGFVVEKFVHNGTSIFSSIFPPSVRLNQKFKIACTTRSTPATRYRRSELTTTPPHQLRFCDSPVLYSDKRETVVDLWTFIRKRLPFKACAYIPNSRPNKVQVCDDKIAFSTSPRQLFHLKVRILNFAFYSPAKTTTISLLHRTTDQCFHYRHRYSRYCCCYYEPGASSCVQKQVRICIRRAWAISLFFHLLAASRITISPSHFRIYIQGLFRKMRYAIRVFLSKFVRTFESPNTRSHSEPTLIENHSTPPLKDGWCRDTRYSPIVNDLSGGGGGGVNPALSEHKDYPRLGQTCSVDWSFQCQQGPIQHLRRGRHVYCYYTSWYIRVEL